MKKAKVINFKIITPEGVVYENDIDEVTIPTKDGVITVLPNHTPLVSSLAVGELKTKQGEQVNQFALAGGVVEVRPESEVIVLADNTEAASDIDLERAQAAYDRAKEYLKEKRGVADADYARFQAMMEKNLNRINIYRRHRK